MNDEDFGIVTACYAGDYCMVKATCASIRHFCGDVPICVIADGGFCTEELVQTYGVQVLRISALKTPVLSNLCAGSSRAKLAAMWEGPFERYIYLDADAIFWGDILPLFNSCLNADFYVFRPDAWKDFTVETINEVYLCPESLASFDINFRWQGKPLFCAGAFGARRNTIPLERWMEVEAWEKSRPGTFKLYDQGMLNYLVFKLADEGKIRYEEAFGHVTTGDRPLAELQEKFASNLKSPPSKIHPPSVLHFCGKKPLLQYPDSFQRPFLAFRLLHYRNVFGHHAAGRALAWSAVLRDEVTVFRRRLKQKLKRTLGWKSSKKVVP